MKRVYNFLVCFLRGHRPHRTEVYHLTYADGKYDGSHDGYVSYCSRCGARLGVMQ